MLREQMEKRITEWATGKSMALLSRIRDKYKDEPDARRLDIDQFWYYAMLREDGCPPWLAAGNAAGQMARMKNSAGAFHEHARQRMENMPEWQKKAYFEKARKAGINTHGKYHMSGLGPPDDPQAWVHDPDDVKAVCKERNYTCEGMVSHEGHEVPPKQVPLADDLVDEMVRHECRENPDLNEKCRRDRKELSRLRGLVTEKYGRPKSKLTAT